MTLRKWEEKSNKDAVAFFKKFIAAVLKGRFQVVHWGWWSCGQRGKYGVSLYWNNTEETEGE